MMRSIIDQLHLPHKRGKIKERRKEWTMLSTNRSMEWVQVRDLQQESVKIDFISSSCCLINYF